MVVAGSSHDLRERLHEATYSKGQAYVEVPGLVNLVRNDGSEPLCSSERSSMPTTASLRLDVRSAPCNAS